MLTQILKNYTSLTSIRVASRTLDYLLMIYLIRQVISPQILASIVGLQLILNLSLHIAKQCFKPSYLRQKNNEATQTVIISAMNLMSIGVVVTIVSALIACIFQWSRREDLAYLEWTIILYGLSGVCQSLKQKYSVELTLKYQYTKIALIELVSYFPKTILFFFAAKTGLFQVYGILLFGVGKLLFYSFCFIITFFLSRHKSHFLLQKLPHDNSYVASQTKKVVKELLLISVLKMLLQEFQKISLVINHSVQTSSVYSLISHIGSIVVRYLFAPLQEIAYNYYSRGTQTDSIKTLLHLVKGLLYFSTICIAFGFRYSANVLEIVYKQKWVNKESILAFDSYLLLLSVMGINGAMQAFVLAKADHQKTIPKFKYFTVVSSACYFISSYLFLHFGFGASSIFLGNALGMTVRIIISWNLEIKKHISIHEFLRNVLPNRAYYLVLFLCIYASHKIQQKMGLPSLYDFGLGIIFFGFCMLPIVFEYRTQIISFMKEKLKKN